MEKNGLWEINGFYRVLFHQVIITTYNHWESLGVVTYGCKFILTHQ